MQLAEVCRRLHKFLDEHTIYACEPWTPASEALVALEPDEGGVPAAAAKRGLAYFLEVYLAREFIADGQASLPTPASNEETCQRLIDYATNDA